MTRSAAAKFRRLDDVITLRSRAGAINVWPGISPPDTAVIVPVAICVQLARIVADDPETATVPLLNCVTAANVAELLPEMLVLPLATCVRFASVTLDDPITPAMSVTVPAAV